MRSIRDTLAIAWKDFQLIYKDIGGLLILFGLPLLVGSMMASIYNNMDITGEKGFTIGIVLVDQDGGPYSEQLVKILKDIDVLDIQAADSVAEAEAQILNGTTTAAIVIPTGLSQNLDSYVPSKIEVVIDPAQTQFGNIITGILKEIASPIATQGELVYGIRSVLDESGLLQGATQEQRQAAEAQTMGVLMSQVLEIIQNPTISIRTENLTGADIIVPDNWFSAFLPMLTVMFAFFIVPGIAPELIREKREGTMRRLMSAPILKYNIMFGKMLAYLVIVILQVIILFGIGNIVFKMPLSNEPLGMLLITLALGLSATSLGVMVAGLSKSERQADALGMVLGFLLAGIGGCIQVGLIPTFRMEGFLGTLSKFVPHSYALDAYRILMIESGMLADVLPNILILLGFALVFFAIGVWKFKYD